MGRIISGSAKGMRLSAPRGTSTRPTTDRVREALFSSLVTWFDSADAPSHEQLAGAAVLDLFAGSGAVGLEAASRGAGRVVAVDHHTAGTVRENAVRTGLRIEVVASRAESAVATLQGPFDVVFIDPPYEMASDAVDHLLSLLVEHGRLAGECLVVVERAKRAREPSWPEGFTRTWSRNYGETTLHFGAFDDEEAK